MLTSKVVYEKFGVGGGGSGGGVGGDEVWIEECSLATYKMKTSWIGTIERVSWERGWACVGCGRRQQQRQRQKQKPWRWRPAFECQVVVCLSGRASVVGRGQANRLAQGNWVGDVAAED